MGVAEEVDDGGCNSVASNSSSGGLRGKRL